MDINTAKNYGGQTVFYIDTDNLPGGATVPSGVLWYIGTHEGWDGDKWTASYQCNVGDQVVDLDAIFATQAKALASLKDTYISLKAEKEAEAVELQTKIEAIV